MAGKTPEHRISIRIGDKIFAGHTENGLSIKPNFEPVLLKQSSGRKVEEFIDADIEMNVVGLTYKKSLGEVDSHVDYSELRALAAIGGRIDFVYGDLTGMTDLVIGQANIIEFSETAGSTKKAGNWTCKLRGVKGTIALPCPALQVTTLTCRSEEHPSVMRQQVINFQYWQCNGGENTRT